MAMLLFYSSLVSIPHADALSLHYPFYMPLKIPIGLYAEHPTIPVEPISTVSVKAFLAASEKIPNQLVNKALTALYQGDLCITPSLTRSGIVRIIPKEQAKNWSEVPLHPAARIYFEPYSTLGFLASLSEFLSGTYELLAAAFLAFIFLRNRLFSAKEKEEQAIVAEQKQRLDAFLLQAMQVEQVQIETEDTELLKQYLDEVTRIKLKALNELTHEKLRDKQCFFILLIQCSNLILKIQDKIILHKLRDEDKITSPNYHKRPYITF
jgi:hypothetical protein